MESPAIHPRHGRRQRQRPAAGGWPHCRESTGVGTQQKRCRRQKPWMQGANRRERDSAGRRHGGVAAPQVARTWNAYIFFAMKVCIDAPLRAARIQPRSGGRQGQRVRGGEKHGAHGARPCAPPTSSLPLAPRNTAALVPSGFPQEERGSKGVAGRSLGRARRGGRGEGEEGSHRAASEGARYTQRVAQPRGSRGAPARWGRPASATSHGVPHQAAENRLTTRCPRRPKSRGRERPSPLSSPAAPYALPRHPTAPSPPRHPDFHVLVKPTCSSVYTSRELPPYPPQRHPDT